MSRRSSRIQQKKATESDAPMNEETQATDASGRKHARDADDEDFIDEDDEDEPRRRGRKRSKKHPASKAAKPRAVESNEDQNSTDPIETNAKMKQRMPEEHRKVKGKLGLLERLAKDVPLDVIIEIFCYLEPGDLLRLARASKDLRRILMSKSSESIWRICRENYEGPHPIPERPEDLNEPQYAHLLYESYCHICEHKGKCDQVLWTFRIRCCKTCALTKFPRRFSHEYMSSIPTVYDVVPSETIRGTKSYRRVCLGNNEIAAQFKAEFEGFQTEEERSAWMTKKKEEGAKRFEHARRCQLWLQSRLDVRSDELNDIRTERKEAILNRLEKIGWREEAEKLMETAGGWRRDDFSYHKSVRQTKKLTDYGWNRIKDELIKLLSTHRTQRLERERRSIITSRYSQLSSLYSEIRAKMDLREPYPAVGNVLTERAIEDMIWETPITENLTHSFLRSKLEQHLPQIIAEWKPAKIQELLEIMRKTRPEATTDDLQLATTVFECTKCHARMHYPQVFYHVCFQRNPSPDSRSHERISSYNYDGKGLWMSHAIAFSEVGSEIAQKLVEGCGLNPSTATVQDLHEAQPLIECLSCDPGWDAGRMFMRWPIALAHQKEHVLAVNSFGEDTENILASEPATRTYASLICCTYCHKHMEAYNLVQHLKEAHGIDDLESFPYNIFKASQEHWYWNPRCMLGDMGNVFKYRKPEPESKPTTNTMPQA